MNGLDERINFYLTFNGPVMTIFAEVVENGIQYVGSGSCTKDALNSSKEPFEFMLYLKNNAQANLKRGMVNTIVPNLDTTNTARGGPGGSGGPTIGGGGGGTTTVAGGDGGAGSGPRLRGRSGG